MLNLTKYNAKAKYSKTKRNRSLTVIAPSAAFVEKKLLLDGYLPPIDVTIVKPKEPTLRQKELCRKLDIFIPEGACFEDVSALINNVITGDTKPPSEGLKAFATNHGIIFSSYLCKKGLYDMVFNKLPMLDKIAFFIFSVYRSLSDDRRSNMDKHPYVNIFYEFAKDKIDDKRYLKSMSLYSGSDIRFFGTITYQNLLLGDKTYKGGKITTIAYQEAKTYLIDTGVLLPNVSEQKYMPDKNTTTPKYKELLASARIHQTDFCSESDHNSHDNDFHNFILLALTTNFLILIISFLFIIKNIHDFILLLLILFTLNCLVFVKSNNKK